MTRRNDDTTPFSVRLSQLVSDKENTKTREDRPTHILRTDIRTARTVFQPRGRSVEDGSKEDDMHVEELVRALKAKPHDQRFLDDILVYAIGRSFYVIDGHHRLLAYERAGVNVPIPVQHQPGSLDDAIAEAMRRNAKDRLAMSHADKADCAWKLVSRAKLSKAKIAEVAGVSISTVAEMRRVWDALAAQQRDKGRIADLTWAEARKALKGDDRESLPDYTDEMRQAQGRELGRLLMRKYATRLRADVLASGIESYREELVRELIEGWADDAVAFVEELRETGELTRMTNRAKAEAEPEDGPDEPDQF